MKNVSMKKYFYCASIHIRILIIKCRKYIKIAYYNSGILNIYYKNNEPQRVSLFKKSCHFTYHIFEGYFHLLFP
jgi:hypothetical protein